MLVEYKNQLVYPAESPEQFESRHKSLMHFYPQNSVINADQVSAHNCEICGTLKQ